MLKTFSLSYLDNFFSFHFSPFPSKYYDLVNYSVLNMSLYSFSTYFIAGKHNHPLVSICIPCLALIRGALPPSNTQNYSIAFNTQKIHNLLQHKTAQNLALHKTEIQIALQKNYTELCKHFCYTNLQF